MNKIQGGAFLVARKIFDSEIWLSKPASWKVIWIYILGKVNYTASNGLEAGEGYFNFTKECKLIDIDCTPDKIKKFIQYAKQGRMGGPVSSTDSSTLISTRRSTRGMIIKVLNYSKYQDLSNFRSTRVSTDKSTDSDPNEARRYITNNKGEKEKEKDFFSENKITDEEIERERERLRQRDAAFIEGLLSGSIE